MCIAHWNSKGPTSHGLAIFHTDWIRQQGNLFSSSLPTHSCTMWEIALFKEVPSVYASGLSGFVVVITICDIWKERDEIKIFKYKYISLIYSYPTLVMESQNFQSGIFSAVCYDAINFTYCFVWVLNLVAHPKEHTQTRCVHEYIA
jgi:hypothetical protein